MHSTKYSNMTTHELIQEASLSDNELVQALLSRLEEYYKTTKMVYTLTGKKNG